ncbi:MAG TPA: YcnI family protein [Catenuloplanes sp.]
MSFTAGVTLFGVFAVAGPAAAHVTVNPTEATQGGYTRVAFRVPTESDTASTTKLEVSMPTQAPIANVSTMPVPGWTVQVDKGKPATPIQGEGGPVAEVVTKITWTADSASAIKPGQFQEFPVSLGPLPQVDQLVFKALQTYSDGNVVRWIDEPTPGAEPESPAPVLKLAKGAAPAAPVASGAAAPGASGAAVKTSPVAAEQGDADSDGMAVGLAVAGLVAGLAGLALGGLAFARTRRVAPPA